MRRLSSVLIFGLLITAASAAEWTEFRGPSGQGVSDQTGVPVTWSETNNVTWKAPIPGLGWSSPVVSGGKIYLSTSIDHPAEGDKLSEHELRAICVNGQTGAMEWNTELFHRTGPLKMHGKNSHASGTPLIDGDRIYFHYGPHGTACVKTTGEVVWKNEELTYAPQHGTGGSPALADDLLIICCDGADKQYVVGLDKATGQIRWKTARDTMPQKGFSFCTPLVTTINNQKMAICPGSEAVFAYEPATGKEIWRVRYGHGYSVVPRPVLAQGLVFVSSSYDQAQLLAIDPTGHGDITDTHVKWQTDKQAPHNPSMVAVDDMLFYVSDRGIATCADARTGDIHWQERIDGNYSASPLAVDGKVYFQDENGEATVVAASKKFEVIAKNSFAEDERTFASYAVDGPTLLIRSERHLYRIGAPRTASR
ncbi:MAG: serine/threonine protein kinase [Planctomycetota bacterium]|nr:MAG: serine/threonine protein kinase [Planctomycetota bacterium]